MTQLLVEQRYKLMTSTIVPRPIAWVTSQSASGIRNAAPYSFFNMMGVDPPIVALGIMHRPDGTYKDTADNIRETREFVINLVCESDAVAMNFSCIDAPPELDEIATARIDTAPSMMVAPPRIVSAPVSMECRLFEYIDTSPSSSVVLGEVLIFHIADRLIERDTFHVDTAAMRLIARMHGSGWYTRATDLFQLQRLRYADWLRGEKG